MALSQQQPSSPHLKLPGNLFAIGALVRSVFTAAGWPREAAHAETVAGFPGEQPRQLITSTQLAAAPILFKQGSPAIFPMSGKGPPGLGGEAGESRG